jgi:hypothetical protein
MTREDLQLIEGQRVVCRTDDGMLLDVGIKDGTVTVHDVVTFNVSPVSLDAVWLYCPNCQVRTDFRPGVVEQVCQHDHDHDARCRVAEHALVCTECGALTDPDRSRGWEQDDARAAVRKMDPQ